MTIRTHIYEPLNDEVLTELATKVDKVTGSSLVADTEITKIHTQGTDPGLDAGGANPVTAAELVTLKDTTVPAKADKLIPTITQATTDTLSVAEVSSTIISNYGQGAENTQTLPTAAEGYNFIAQISTAGAGAFHIKAGANDYIILDGTALNDADKVSCATPALGDCITFWTIQTGAAEWQWMAKSGNGTWSDGGA